MHGEHAIENRGGDKVIVGHRQLHAHHQRFDPANHQKDQRIANIKQSNALVVYGGNPGSNRIQP